MDLGIFSTMESEVRGYIRSYPVIFDRAVGSTMWDIEGNEYLDFFGGAGTLSYGHNNPLFKTAIIEYLERDSILHGLDMATVAKKRFMETFKAQILEPRGLEYKLQFTGPTGTNAVEAALKLARIVTGRTTVVAFTRAFHGVSAGSLAASANSKFRDAAGITLDNVVFHPYDGYFGENTDTIAQLEKLITDTNSGLDLPAAIIVETVQAEGGINVARPQWLQRLAALAKQNDILLIVDDIQIGSGRSGDFFSFEEAGIKPDIVTLSKALSGYGMPMSMVLLKPELDAWKPGSHSGTFRGNNLAFVGAVRAIEEYWSDDAFSKEIHRKSALVRARLNEIADRFPDTFVVRGRGLLLGLVGHKDKSLAGKIAAECFNRKLIIETSGAGDEALKLLPALTMSDEDLLRGLDIIEAATEKVVTSH